MEPRSIPSRKLRSLHFPASEEQARTSHAILGAREDQEPERRTLGFMQLPGRTRAIAS